MDEHGPLIGDLPLKMLKDGKNGATFFGGLISICTHVNIWSFPEMGVYLC